MKNKEWLREALDKLTTGFNGRELSRYEMGRLDGYTHATGLIDQLDEPEKVAIPQFVAVWIEECKKDKTPLNLAYDVMAFGDVAEWLYDQENADNIDLFAKAWLDGFTVEKEKVYQVIFPDGSNLVSEAIDDFDNKNTFIGKPGDMGIHSFTEKTIKSLDPRYWAFAVEVTDED